MKKPPPPPPADPTGAITKLLTPRQLADILQLSLPTLRRYVASGAIPSVQIGNRVRFEPADVLQFIKDGKKTKL